MKTKDRLDELEAQLDHLTNRIDHLRDEFVDHIEKTNRLKEPLIKDENIRKIIRAWADENNTTVVEYKLFKNEFVDGYLNIIGFNRKFDELYNKSYTIDELCGEDK